MRLRDRPLSHWARLAALGQLAVRALVGGTALVVDPSGGLVNAPPAPLAATPVDDFLLPGIALVAAFGICPIFAGYGLQTRRRWGHAASAAVGVALATWVGIEVGLGFDRPTLALNLATAVALVTLSARPLVRSAADLFAVATTGQKRR